MNVLFLGTPEFAVHTLLAVSQSNHRVVAVVTAPDKAAGRGLKPKMSDVKKAALQMNIPVLQPENLPDDEFIQKCKDLKPDIAVVVAFRKLPEKLWKLPIHGTFNLHASLLPHYRGAAPINWALINGEKETGLTTFFINEGIDTGSVIHRIKIPIMNDDNAGRLHDRLAAEGARLVVKSLDSISRGNISPQTQDEIIRNENISFIRKAPRIFKDDCRIDWTKSSEQIRNLIRGLSPHPTAFSNMKHETGKTILLKIFDAEICSSDMFVTPGHVVLTKNSMLIGTGDGNCLMVTDVQPESKSRMSVRAFINGLKDPTAWVFDE